MLRKWSLMALLFFTVVNLAIFFARDAFQYQPYADYRTLYGECDSNCEKTWRQYADDYGTEELAAARIVTDSILGKEESSTYKKLLGIGGFLYQQFHTRLGKPSAALLSSSPLQQYHTLAASDTAQLWCGNLAQMFSFFCWSQDIPCRNVEIMNPGDRHVVNECYVPELRRWLITDLTSGLLLVRNGTGAYLDLPSFMDSLRKNAPLTAWQQTEDGLQQLPIDTTVAALATYYRPQHPLYYYHRTDTDKAYATGAKIRRYFQAGSWYDIYDTEGRGNTRFRLKQAALLLWALSFFVFTISRAKFRK